MADVRGFYGFRFQEGQVKSFDNVITPAYDVISEETRRELVALSPYNMARILLPEEREGLSRYDAAARDFEDWIAQGVLRQDTQESFYLIEQQFFGADGLEYLRRGFFAVTRIPEESEKLVLGHERTFDKPVEDRLSLTESTRANLGPIFVLYSDPDQHLKPFLDQIAERPASLYARTCDGTGVRLWRVPYDESVTAFFSDKKLYIADGHHRFATARVYRDRMREKEKPDGPRPYDFVLMGLVAFEDPGLSLRPPHRLLATPADFRLRTFLKSLKPWFNIQTVRKNLPETLAAASGCAFGLVTRDEGQHLLTLKDVDRAEWLGGDHSPAWRDLDVAVLHRGIFENVLGLSPDTEFTYEPDTQKALELIKNGQRELAFLLNPTRPEQIRACAEAGDAMPPKSTYFFPKLPSGAVIHRLV